MPIEGEQLVIPILFSKQATSKGIQMSEEKKLLDHQAFSIATLIYARLRRVSGRVIDALYLVEDKSYALYVIEIAKATHDNELLRLCERLSTQMNIRLDAENDMENAPFSTDLPAVKPTNQDVYEAQVSHHYIGALR